jgi:LysM repeat protein
MPTRPRHPLATSTTAAVTAAILLAAPVAAADPTITVKAGDTLSQIAVDHGTSVERLAQANGLPDPNRIQVGQQLVLVPAEAPAATAPATSQAPLVHVVASGETLTGIAAHYGTSVAAIAALNGLANPSFLLPGQQLVVGAAPVPAAQPAPASVAPPAPLVHVVASGETLTGISARYGTTVGAIAAANGLADPSFIRTGTQLTVPAAAAAPPVAPAPAAPPFPGMPPDLRAAVAERLAIGEAIRAEAQAMGLPPALAMAVGWQESGWQQGLTSSAGAVGVMQLLPTTGDWVASSILGAPVDVWETGSNIRAGVRLLKHYHDRYGGDRARILAAYYQGQFALETDGIYQVSWPYINAVTALEAMFAS